MITDVNQLTGAALDWAVAKCEGVEFTYEDHPTHELIVFQYSINWVQGGPIIEREGIALLQRPMGYWVATSQCGRTCEGDTPLIAAMRAYVVSKLGSTVDVPDELLEAV